MKKLIWPAVLAVISVALLWAPVPTSAGDITANGMSQADLYKYYVHLRDAVNNQCLTDAGVGGYDTSSLTASIAADLTFTVNGVFYSNSATTSIPITGTVPTLKTGYYLLCAGPSDTWTSVLGKCRATDEGISMLAPVPSGYAPFGYLKIVNASTGSFIGGTTKFNATGITATWVDLKNRPLHLNDL